MKTLRIAMMLTLLASALVLSSCSDDDGDDGGTDPVVPKEWHGTWLSAGDNVAPLLVAVFNYDSVRVFMDPDNTVTLMTHVVDGAWTTTEGTYSVTETAKSGVLAVELIYPAFSQEGIIQVTTDPLQDMMQLEVVQTVPDIGAVPRTPATGFGSDATLLDTNIQVYREQ